MYICMYISAFYGVVTKMMTVLLDMVTRKVIFAL